MHVDSRRNNDKTAQIFSLSQMKPLVTLTYVTQMNHASMSPDGNLILAVGDRGQAFFHRRIPFENSSIGDKAFMAYGWMAVAEPLLRQVSDIDACFATGFSPSGHRCVVASEGGIITVFDTSLVNDEMEGEDAVVCIMKTSRPSTRPDLIGAARALSFSPTPWDLLAIAEDQGRVTVFDLRDPEFLFRQTLDISVDDSNVVLTATRNLHPSNGTAMNRMMEQRVRQSALIEQLHETSQLQERYAAVASSADELEQSIQRQNLQAENIGRELQSLVENAGDNMESTRQAADALGVIHTQLHDENLPSSTPTTNSEDAIHGPALLPSNYDTLPTERQREALIVQERINRSRLIAGHARLGLEPWHHATRPEDRMSPRIAAEYMHQHYLEEREHQRTSDRQPRRRSSVVITNSNSRTPNDSHSTLAPIGTATPTLSTSPSRISASSNDTSPIPPNNHWSPPQITRPRTNISTTTPEIWQSLPDETSANRDTDLSRDTLAERVARARRMMGTTHLRRSTSVSRLLPVTATMNDPRLHPQVRPPAGVSRADLTVLQRTRDQLATHMRELGSETITIDPDRGSQSRVGGVVILGIGFSQDGRSLFVATEWGMLEYKVNIRERMQWPGVGFL